MCVRQNLYRVCACMRACGENRDRAPRRSHRRSWRVNWFRGESVYRGEYAHDADGRKRRWQEGRKREGARERKGERCGRGEREKTGKKRRGKREMREARPRRGRSHPSSRRSCNAGERVIAFREHAVEIQRCPLFFRPSEQGRRRKVTAGVRYGGEKDCRVARDLFRGDALRNARKREGEITERSPI